MTVRPTLRIEIPLEGNGDVYLDADTYEDELRLRSWLRRSRLLDDLAVILVRLLDDLDTLSDRKAT